MASGSEELFSGDERNDRRYSYPLQTSCSESEYAPDSESGDESENQHSKEGEERIIQELFSRRKKTPGKDHLTKKARLDPATKQHGARSNDSTFVTTPSRPQVSRHNSSLHSSSASKSHANRVTPPSTTDLRANSQTKDKESDVSHDWSPTVRRHSDALVLETEQGKVTTALGEINVLKDVVRRLTTTEEKLQLMEQRVRTPVTPGSSSSESSGKKARSIPKIVRSETRKMYQTLLDEDEQNFHGFDVSENATFKHPTNRAVVDYLATEVCSLNPTFLSYDVRAAAYTYYKTLRQEESRRRRGKSEQRTIQRRHHERLIRKLRQRHSTFQRQSFNEDDRKKWEKFLIVDFMSSEESDVEDAEPVLVVKALPWRSERVTRFLMKLDEKTQQSEQSQRQSKRRVRSRKSMVSDRPAPLNGSMPSWTIIHVRGK